MKKAEIRLGSGILLTQPISLRFISYLLMIFAFVILVFLNTNSYERKEKVSGYLVPNKGLVRVYSPRTGIVSEMYVVEGDRVKAGDKLFRILSDEASPNGEYIGEKVLGELKDRKENLLKQVGVEYDKAKNQLSQLEEQKKYLSSEIVYLKSLKGIRKDIYDIGSVARARAEKLHRKGNLSATDSDYAIRINLEQRERLQEAELDIVRAETRRADIDARIKLVNTETELIVLDIKTRISNIIEQILRTEKDRLNVILAPTDGYISSTAVYNGQGVNLGASVISIVPSGSVLEVHLYVPTRAIGFLEKDQDVNIRYDAFPYQRFGLYSGKVAEFSESILSVDEIPRELKLSESTYRVIVALDDQEVTAFGRKLDLKAGMTLSADIVLSERSLIEWLFEPIYSLRGGL